MIGNTRIRVHNGGFTANSLKKLDQAFDREFGDSVTIGVALASWGGWLQP